MAANRILGVRAIVYYDGPIEIIKLSRLHNNANILSLGARFLSPHRAKELIGWHTFNNTLVALSRGKINGVIRILPH